MKSQAIFGFKWHFHEKSHLQMESLPGYLGCTREESYRMQTSQSHKYGELVSFPILISITKGSGEVGRG